MHIIIESKQPVHAQSEAREFLHWDVRATVSAAEWVSSSTFILDLPEDATEDNLKAAVLALYAPG